MAATKKILINATFEVVPASGIAEIKKTTTDTNTVVTEVTTTSPQVIPGLTVNAPVPMGGVTLGKRIFIRTDQEVTLKIGSALDAGFKFGPGDGFWPSTSGIPSIFITTGPNATAVEAVITGD